MKDMDDLNVLWFDVIICVIEYVFQIVKFVEKIVEKGFVYEVDGFIYFDIIVFEKVGNIYVCLCFENWNDKFF